MIDKGKLTWEQKKSNSRISFVYVRFLIVGVFCSSTLLNAGELGHYMPGVASIRDFPVPPEPGFIYEQYNLLYSTDTYVDRNGNEVSSLNIGPASVNIDADIDTFAIQPTFIWTTDKMILGALYAPYLGIPVVSTSFQAALSTETRFGRSVDDSEWGLGDVYVQPIWLGWNTKHFGAAIAYRVYAPTGEYDDGAIDNTGLGFWTHQFQAGVSWYPWEHQGTAIMINGAYEIHHEKDGVDITPGDRFSLKWNGVSANICL